MKNYQDCECDGFGGGGGMSKANAKKGVVEVEGRVMLEGWVVKEILIYNYYIFFIFILFIIINSKIYKSK